VAACCLCAAAEKNLELETVAAPLKTADYDAFLTGMEALGYVEGRDFKVEYRSVDGHPDRFPKLAQELVNQNVDLITTRGTPNPEACAEPQRTQRLRS
jgi:hypothetical protein